MKRVGLVLTSAILMVALAVPVQAAAPKAGAKCTKAGATATASGMKYTCIKSGTKLVWNKGVAIKAAAPKPISSGTSTTKPSATPAPTSASSSAPTPSSTPGKLSTSDPVGNCKIQDSSNPYVGEYGGALYGGFIDKKTPVPSSGDVTWYLVPLEFADLKGESNWRSRIEQQIQTLTDYYETVSYGKLKIKWIVHDTWITLPGNQSSYQINQSGDYIATEKFWKESIALADAKINFSGVQVINFLLPKNQTAIKESAQGFPWTGDINKYNSTESKIASFTVLGQFFEATHRSYWSYWAHEYGHTLGIPHISGSRTSSSFQTYDLMGNQDSRRELSGWSRFAVTNWLEDRWIYCKNKSNVDSEIVNLIDLNSQGDGIKLAVIPLSTTKALLIESRKNTKFTGTDSVRGNTDGVLVYVYDATLGHNSDYLFAASGNTDPILTNGESVSYDGIKIKVISLGVDNKILITKEG